MLGVEKQKTSCPQGNKAREGVGFEIQGQLACAS